MPTGVPTCRTGCGSQRAQESGTQGAAERKAEVPKSPQRRLERHQVRPRVGWEFAQLLVKRERGGPALGQGGRGLGPSTVTAARADDGKGRPG